MDRNNLLPCQFCASDSYTTALLARIEALAAEHAKLLLIGTSMATALGYVAMRAATSEEEKASLAKMRADWERAMGNGGGE
jgi:hypothetical protein